jgi:acetyl esterase/lipase
MSIKVAQTPLFSGQPRFVQGLLAGDHVKRGVLLCWAALFTIGAAIMHFMGGSAQLPQFVLMAALLLGFAIIQLVVALAIVIVPARRLLMGAAILDSIAVLLWFVARTIGLPIGLTVWRPEVVSVVDFFVPVMEGLAALLLLGLVVRHSWTRKPRVWLTAPAALPILFLVCFITGIVNIPWLGPAPAASEAWLPVSEAIRAPAGQMTTVPYCQLGFGGSPFAMDISEPTARAARPAPMVFYIHGGEGLAGFRQLSLDQDGTYFIQLRSELLNRGFVVGSIDYGLSPTLYRGIDEVKAAKCAVRFLRAHATELGIDPRRIGVYGSSQGGYIATMLGTVGPDAGYDVGQYLDQSSRVQAVVDMWGPADLANFSGSPSWVKTIGQLQSAGSFSSATSGISRRVQSPVNDVAAGDPPFLIIHGADDWFIAPHHSQVLAQRLHAAGVPVTLVMVKNDGHGLDAPTAEKIEQPSPDALVHMISDFFAKTLAA